MRQTTRLILNALAMFGRMFVTFGLGLVATRLLIGALGFVDYGILTALGATGIIMTLLTDSLTSSVQRHLSYEVGRADADRLRAVFNTALLLFLGAAALAFLIGQAAGPVILDALTVPAERSAAAWWAYQMAILGVALAIAQTPYAAVANAQQALVMTSALGVVGGVLRFLAVLALFVLPGDRLVWFSILALAAAQAASLMLTGICLWRFDECRPRPRRFLRSELRRIGGFAGWTLLGTLGWRLRMQGGLILLNLFFGPVVNAAYAIGMNVIAYVQNFAGALQKVVHPAMVAAEGRGQREQVHRLALTLGKYNGLLLSFLIVPMVLDTDQVLSLWLGEYPPHAAVFARLLLISGLMTCLSSGFVAAVQAEGNVGWFTRRSGALSTAPLAAAAAGFWWLDWPAWALPAAGVVAELGFTYLRIVTVGRRLNLPPMRWVRQTLLPVLAVMSPGLAAAGTVWWTLPEGYLRLACVTLAYGVVAAPLAWWVGLEAWERKQFADFAGSLLRKAGLATDHTG